MLVIRIEFFNALSIPLMPPPESREGWIVREARKRLPAEPLVFLDDECPQNAAFRPAQLVAPKPRDAPTFRETGIVRPALRSDLAGALDGTGWWKKLSLEAPHL